MATYLIEKFQGENTEPAIKAAAFIDSAKPYGEQTIVAQQHIHMRENVIDVTNGDLSDGNNRLPFREYEYPEGFKVKFQQNYKSLSWEVASQTVIEIKD